MRHIVRVNLQFKRRFWNEEEQLRGLTIACTDLPLERLWDITALQSGKEGILTAYIQFRNAVALEKTPTHSQIIQQTLEQIETFFPQASEEFLKGFVWIWSNQKWIQGGWAAYERNQTHLFRAMQLPHDRVFFAGDHTSLYNGWIQGALESAHLAIAEMILGKQQTIQPTYLESI
jgi:monoamine oxidase